MRGRGEIPFASMEKEKTVPEFIEDNGGCLLGGLRFELPFCLHTNLTSSLFRSVVQGFIEPSYSSCNFGDSKLYHPQHLSLFDRILNRRYVPVEAFELGVMKQFFSNFLNEKNDHPKIQLANALNALTMFNCFLEFQLGDADFEKSKAATQQRLNLLQSELTSLPIYRENDSLNLCREHLLDYLGRQEQRDSFTDIQRTTCSTFFEMIESYKHALTEQYYDSIFKYKIFDVEWIELHKLTERLKVIPTRKWKGKLYYQLGDVNKVFNDFRKTDMSKPSEEYKAALTPYVNVIGRMQYIHNLPILYKTKEQYMEKFSTIQTIPLGDDFFEVYLLMENKEYLEKLIIKRKENGMRIPDYEAMNYLYENEKFKANLKHLGSLLDWDASAKKLYAQ